MKKYRILKPEAISLGVNSLAGTIYSADELKKAGYNAEDLVKEGIAEVFSPANAKAAAEKVTES